MTIINRRKFFAGFGVALAGLSTAAIAAQREGKGGQMLDRQISVLKERLSLSAEQEAQVRSIFEEQAAQMKQIQEKHGGRERGKRPSAEAMEEFRNLRQQTQDRLAKVLDERQLAQYEKLRQERGDNMREGVRNRRGRKQRNQ